ncbi:hypothetical protein [Streptomyces sp. NPDC018711]|uniref:hypothetical protein n=1 Tax=Streptomyces sp. NPDC018711 TaxID=3365052 RepID=UPI00378A5B32
MGPPGRRRPGRLGERAEPGEGRVPDNAVRVPSPIGDPKPAAPGTAASRADLTGYRPLSGSAAVDAGPAATGNGGHDSLGAALPVTVAVGAVQGAPGTDRHLRAVQASPGAARTAPGGDSVADPSPVTRR